MYFGLDRSDRPMLFIPTDDKETSLALRTDAVSLNVGQSWQIHDTQDEVVVGRFHALGCQATEAASLETFLLIVDAVVRRYPERPPGREDLSKLFISLTRLFRTPPEMDVASGRQGLWAELFLIQHLGGASRWAGYWHSDPYRRWDFTFGMHHIEVKSTVGPAHAHMFSHRQLFAPAGHTVAIVSILLQPMATGLSLGSLIADTRRELQNDINSLLKLEAAVRAVDLTDQAMSGPTFSTDAAEKNIAWYWAAAVPRFTQTEPAGVSNTHYRVDLSTTPPIAMLDVDAWIRKWE